MGVGRSKEYTQGNDWAVDHPMGSLTFSQDFLKQGTCGSLRATSHLWHLSKVIHDQGGQKSSCPQLLCSLGGPAGLLETCQALHTPYLLPGSQSPHRMKPGHGTYSLQRALTQGLRKSGTF